MAKMNINNPTTSSGKTIIKENKYDVVNDAMYLWGVYSDLYRNLPEEYERLLEEKRTLGLKLHTITKSDLKDYPEIKFLKLETSEEAKEYLLDKRPSEIQAIIRDIKSMAGTNYAFRTLRNNVEESIRQIKKARDKTSSTYKTPLVGKI